LDAALKDVVDRRSEDVMIAGNQHNLFSADAKVFDERGYD